MEVRLISLFVIPDDENAFHPDPQERVLDLRSTIYEVPLFERILVDANEATFSLDEYPFTPLPIERALEWMRRQPGDGFWIRVDGILKADSTIGDDADLESPIFGAEKTTDSSGVPRSHHSLLPWNWVIEATRVLLTTTQEETIGG